jgi:wyosine [tRNA(Phe)-imidazoG37] synthetase (radical SAM superfamily)
MKKIMNIVLLLCALTLLSFGENRVDNTTKMTRGDVKIIEATENIRYLSQKIAKEYFFFYTYPENEKIKKNLYEALKALSRNLQVISAVTKDADTNNLLEFLAYSKEEILNILKKKPNKEYAILMLDYSETLLEGADSIGRTYSYAFSKEEEMLVASKNVSYLLERIMKYYMALYHGYNTQNNRTNLQQSIEELKSYFVKINAYDYPGKIHTIRQKINLVWHRDREILNRVDQYFVPMLLSDSVIFLEEKIDVLARYHSQNL